MANATLLGKHPMLMRLELAHLERIAAAGQVEAWNPDEVVVHEGAFGEAMYLVLTGRVAVLKAGHALAELTSGDFFGEMSLVEPAPRSATVTAVEPSYLFRLPHDALRQLITDSPDASNALLIQIVRTLSERLRRGNATISSVGALADWLAGSMV